MPSIKKRVTGFIRQLSAPNGGGSVAAAAATRRGDGARDAPSGASRRPPAPPERHESAPREGLIQQYLDNGEPHRPGPSILSGKTGHDLPVLRLAPLAPEIFAAFTGPDGGVTAIGSGVEAGAAAPTMATEDADDFDFIDIDDLGAKSCQPSQEDGTNEETSPEVHTQPDLTTWRGDSTANKNNCTDRHRKEFRSPGEQRRQRELSVESDYPELSLDFPMRSSNADDPGGSRGAGSVATSIMLSRRLKQDLRNDCETVIAGVRHWNRPNNAATGQSVTLYERHPHTAEHAGNPVADTFAVVARKNSALLVLGDGVNWGSRAALAARCAVYGAMEHLNTALFTTESNANAMLTTTQVFQCLLRSFHAAHSLILQEKAHLTTLTACVVLPVYDSDDEDKEKFVACVCNVGDSLAYVYSTLDGHVREITQGSHDIQSNRDMRDALGALGPVDGINPELSNLTCSLTFVEPGDIVFVTSDGISDNFDPVVGKFCVPAKESADAQNGRSRPTPNSPSPRLPSVEAYQRHELTLLRMEDVLNRGSEAADQQGLSRQHQQQSSGRVSSAAELCHRMVDFCHRLTAAKRAILEDPELYPEHTRHALPDSDASRLDQKLRRRKVCEKLAQVPGKLDHATIVAYAVEDRRNSLKNFTGGHIPAVSVGDELPVGLRAPCASTEDLTFRESFAEEEGDRTPTPSVSLTSLPSAHCSSLAVTPVHHPRQDIDLCFDQNEEA